MPRRALSRLMVIFSLTVQPLAALACADRAPGLDEGASVSVGRIADLTWVAAEVAGQPVPEGAEVTFSVDRDGKIGGRAGCNHYGGQAEMDAGSLVPGPMAMTEMACAEPLMALEHAYLTALSEVRGFAVGPDGLLYLTRPDGSVGLCMRP